MCCNHLTCDALNWKSLSSQISSAFEKLFAHLYKYYEDDNFSQNAQVAGFLIILAGYVIITVYNTFYEERKCLRKIKMKVEESSRRLESLADAIWTVKQLEQQIERSKYFSCGHVDPLCTLLPADEINKSSEIPKRDTEARYRRK